MALRVFCLCLSLLIGTMGPCAASWSDGQGSCPEVLPQPEAPEWGLVLCGLMTVPSVGPQGRRQEARPFHGQTNMWVKECPPHSAGCTGWARAGAGPGGGSRGPGAWAGGGASSGWVGAGWRLAEAR